jgi:hypothetical protein
MTPEQFPQLLGAIYALTAAVKAVGGVLAIWCFFHLLFK